MVGMMDFGTLKDIQLVEINTFRQGVEADLN